MLYKIPISHRSCHGNQIYTKISPSCTKFNSVQEIEEFFACIVEFTGLVNSYMLPEFFREPRELPWQPNLGKIKPKLH